MIRTFFTILMLLLVCSAASADDPDLPQIAVFGTATTMVTPDTLVWSLNVKNIDLDLEDAADEHNKLVKKVLSTLKKRGVSEKDIQTARMQFGDNIDLATRSKSGYYASTEVSFKTKDFSKYTSLWMDLAQTENVSIQNVTYDHSNRIQYQNETRRNALLAARTKAEMLANTLGSKIGEPLLIEEDQSMQYPSTLNSVRSLGVEDSSEVLAPGEIPIRARVKASFRLINPAQ
ncbi:MAG: SIMPL domain-containing protein [Acidobacteria bacterium]|nr:SIMPL domain-containing protein [Acidobacteriota bacterium]